MGIPQGVGWLLSHLYAVTCRHCLLEGGYIIRVNTRNGESRTFETDPLEWEFDEKGPDIAVLDITGKLNGAADNYSILPDNLFLTKEFIAEVDFGIGEDGLMLGLLADQPGNIRNLIAARFGNVSLLACDDDPLRHPNGNDRPSHSFDTRSRPGFSGSPVFVYRTIAGDLRSTVMRGRDHSGVRVYSIDELRENTFFMLLGLHVGQYPDTVKVEKVTAKDPRKAPLLQPRG